MSIGTAIVCLSLAGATGCAPKSLGPGVEYYTDHYNVRDAGARRTRDHWFFRFDELILSDLDDAIAAGERSDTTEMHRLADQVFRAAASLAKQSAAGEIARLPAPGRSQLAGLADGRSSAESLTRAYNERVRLACHAFTTEFGKLDASQQLQRLKRLRSSIEAAPDDKGRLSRQITFAWAAGPAWLGVEQVEKKLEAKRATITAEAFERAAAWVPADNEADAEITRYAPMLVIEWPQERPYPEDFDRIGEVYLTGKSQDIHVHINPSHPIVYSYRSEAKINGKRFPQMVYVWWFPERPAMEEVDPAAGQIDGDTLRITFDTLNRPAVIEVSQSCGCGHLVFVADHIEKAAAQQYGDALPGKKLVVEKDVSEKRDLIVSGTYACESAEVHPVIYLFAGYHEVAFVHCVDGMPAADASIAERGTYHLQPYDQLERLPLGDGVASMFGPDGLVHHAGRSEGYLLAPTGILSAGQPRKRGTQKIRWDEYSFDDPRLLEKTLRLPDSF